MDFPRAVSVALATLVLAVLAPHGAGSSATTVGAEVFVESRYEQLLSMLPPSGLSTVAVVADPTSVLPSTAEHLVDRMSRDGFGDVRDGSLPRLVVFGPEHGFRGDGQAGTSGGGTPGSSYVDNRTNFTVYNCYGLNRTGLGSLVRSTGVDAIIFDIQDVGARFYTYIWTMYDLLGAAADASADRKRPSPGSLPFLILDRPNPLSGTVVRGPMNPTQSSFVGRANIPLMHGLTVGELGRLFWASFGSQDRETGFLLGECFNRAHARVDKRHGLGNTGLPWFWRRNMPRWTRSACTPDVPPGRHDHVGGSRHDPSVQ